MTETETRLAAPGDLIADHRGRAAHIVRRVSEGTVESDRGYQSRPYATTMCGARMWATLADGPTDGLGVSWPAPEGMSTCSGCRALARKAEEAAKAAEASERGGAA